MGPPKQPPPVTAGHGNHLLRSLPPAGDGDPFGPRGSPGAGALPQLVKPLADPALHRDPQGDRTLEGWRRFAKGRHPAALNLGDCFS